VLQVHGHAGAVRMLESALRGDRLHHAYLFAGPAHVGKTTLAMQVAQAVNCLGPGEPPCGECQGCLRVASGAHADVLEFAVDPEADEGPTTVIGIEDITKVLIPSAHLCPYEGRTRVYVIQGAEHLSQDAANALLKVLEEPPPDVLMLLLTEDEESVLATVRSRCQTIQLNPMPIGEVATLLHEERRVPENQALIIARLSHGCLGWAIEAVEDAAVLAAVHQRLERIADAVDGGLEARFAYADELARRFQRDRAAGRGELFQWLRWVRDMLLVQQGQGSKITNLAWRETIERQAKATSPAQTVGWLRLIGDTLEALERNANPRLALEVLMLEAPSMDPAPA
jgi:DNA polymerase-3 subunit delta'